LEKWVERGPPPKLIACHGDNGVIERCRPVFPYPDVGSLFRQTRSEGGREFRVLRPLPALSSFLRFAFDAFTFRADGNSETIHKRDWGCFAPYLPGAGRGLSRGLMVRVWRLIRRHLTCTCRNEENRARSSATFQARRGPSCQGSRRLHRCFGKTPAVRPWATPPSAHRRTLEGIRRAAGRKRRRPDVRAGL